MEMICDILGVLSEGPTKPTHILYKANMSWKVLSSCLDYLMGRGLVEREDQGGKRSTYKLTQRGRSILKLYDDLRQSFNGSQVPSGIVEATELVGSVPRSGLRASSFPW